MQRQFEDTWIDLGLDHLKDNRLSPLVEVVVAWIISTLCLLYYFYSWCLLLLITPPIASVPLMTFDGSRSERDNHVALCQQLASIEEDSDLIDLIRIDHQLRRQVSKFMVSVRKDKHEIDSLQTATNHRLERLWVDLLKFPPRRAVDRQETTAEPYIISLVIAAYKEKENVISDTLAWAIRHCSHPETVQVVIVLSEDGYFDVAEASSGHPQEWGRIQTVVYSGNGGRGPCQNYGAQYAEGELITFLHADTILPPDWDTRVTSILCNAGEGRITQACAFSFGHNTNNLCGMSYPWGIRSVWMLGNLRAYFLSLPYGDHIISMPRAYFHYVGGYPNQPIMEDYDMMDLLRKRSKVLRNEKIQIIIPDSCKCSVRRWQRFGVVYVTLVNALIVHRYAHGGWTSQHVFDYYYRRPFKKSKKNQ